MDRALINHIYQPIVDWSQKRPVWWSHRCLELECFLLVLLQMLGADRSLWSTGFAVAGTVGMRFVLTEALMALMAVRLRLLRLLYLSFLLLRVLLAMLGALLGQPGDPIAALDLFAVLVGVSAFYFMACRPPAPRPPKHRTRLAGAHS